MRYPLPTLGLAAVVAAAVAASGCVKTAQKAAVRSEESTPAATPDLPSKAAAIDAADYPDIEVDETFPDAGPDGAILPTNNHADDCREGPLCKPDAEKVRKMRSPISYVKSKGDTHTFAVFPKKAVLAAMTRMRDLYYIKESDTAARAVHFKELSSDQAELWIVDRNGDSKFGNLGAAPNHWSDIQAHYYPNTTHGRHTCYTAGLYLAMGLLQAASKGPDGTPRPDFDGTFTVGGRKVSPLDQRRFAIDACLGKLDVTAEAKNLGYERYFSDRYKQAFQAMHKTQWAKNTKGQRLNVFDYVMLSSFHAFDMAEQQEVINAFYKSFDSFDPGSTVKEGSWGPPVTAPKPVDFEVVGKAPYNPYPGRDQGEEIIATCRAVRPARVQDDPNMNYCTANKIFTSAMGPIGR